MLTDLRIKNFAIIEEQTVSFSPGLNVLSGETGAGKSVVLQAIQVLLGARPRPQFLRAGTDSWELEASFDLREIPAELREHLPDIIDGDELVVARSMNRKGRGRVFINGRLATVSLLEEIVSRLVNVCAQGTQMRLLDARYHRELIDGYANLKDDLVVYQEAFERWRKTADALAARERDKEHSARRKAELEFLIDELEELELRPGLREELSSALRKHENAEHIAEESSRISFALGGESGGLLDTLQELRPSFERLEALDPETRSYRSMFQSAITELQEVTHDLQRYGSRVEVHEEELEALREKLARLAAAERKFQCSDKGLISLLESARQELADLDAPESLEKERERVNALWNEALSKAGLLRQARKAAAKTLSKRVQQELDELNMPGASLTAAFEEIELSASGADRLEFLFAPHQKAEPRPLKQIASGGELSRITLVLTKLLQDRSGVHVLVFDEVDTGISGSVARAVGEKLRTLANNSQVLCVTHLAQVASLADHHLMVQKKGSESPLSFIRELEEEEKVDEIARMLAGYKITSAARASARELLSSK